MTITNGYCTLAELKERLLDLRTYTSTAISFANTGAKISDASLGLKRFQTGATISVSGSSANDGNYTIATGNVAGEIVVMSSTLADETAGATVIITDTTHPEDDATLEAIITAASRWIDAVCWRRFYGNSVDEARYYTAHLDDALFTDDIISITSLKTDDDGDRTYENTWTTDDYDLMPYNAALDGQPYTRIEISPYGDYTFEPEAKMGVEITGKFGYCATGSHPDIIREVCILKSARLYKRKDAPLGIAGFPGVGEVRILRDEDPDLVALLTPMKKPI